MAAHWSEPTPMGPREYVVLLSYRDMDMPLPYYVRAHDPAEAVGVVTRSHLRPGLHSGVWAQEVPWRRDSFWDAMHRTSAGTPLCCLPPVGFDLDWYAGAFGRP